MHTQQDHLKSPEGKYVQCTVFVVYWNKRKTFITSLTSLKATSNMFWVTTLQPPCE